MTIKPKRSAGPLVVSCDAVERLPSCKNEIKKRNHQLKLDRVVFVVVIICGIISVCIGVTTFKCLFSGLAYTFATCETTPYENAFYLYFRVSVALDIITDALSE